MQPSERPLLPGSQMHSGSLVPYGLKLPAPTPALAHLQASGLAAAAAAQANGGIPPSPLEIQRVQQLYDYNARLQYNNAMRAYGMPHGIPYGMSPHDALAHAFFAKQLDPRARFMHEEPKPAQSYIGLISMAILQHKDKKLVLADIYQWIMDNFPYFRNRGPGWRNSIRHNLSLNDCFIKSGRSANGKGHYWAIHPANIEDFKRGDFRRRRAQRKVRKAMGLAVPDDEDDSPSPPPSTNATLPDWTSKILGGSNEATPEHTASQHSPPTQNLPTFHRVPGFQPSTTTRKRLFDVESLLAPDTDDSPTARESEEPMLAKQSRLQDDSDVELHPEAKSEADDEDDDDDAPLDVGNSDDFVDHDSSGITSSSRKGSSLIVIEPSSHDSDDCVTRDTEETQISDEDSDNRQRAASGDECDSEGRRRQTGGDGDGEKETDLSVEGDDNSGGASPRSLSPVSRTSSPAQPMTSQTGPRPPFPQMMPSSAAAAAAAAAAWQHHQHATFINTNKSLMFAGAGGAVRGVPPPQPPLSAQPGHTADASPPGPAPSGQPQHAALWSALPSPMYPMLAAPFPLPHGAGSGVVTSATSAADQAQLTQRWHETVNRIMSRSFDKNVKMEA